jgi:hypothetical protein
MLKDQVVYWRGLVLVHWLAIGIALLYTWLAS